MSSDRALMAMVQHRGLALIIPDSCVLHPVSSSTRSMDGPCVARTVVGCGCWSGWARATIVLT